MNIELLNELGQVVGTQEVNDKVFNLEYKESLVHQLVVSYQANARQGTRAQKNRASVKHSTRKPWKQKGTGNARAGMTSSPIWRGGGRAFPSSPDENFSCKVNKKMYRIAMASILSNLLRLGRLSLIENFSVEQSKTKLFVNKLKAMNISSALFIVKEVDDNLFYASRNVPNVSIMEPRYIDPLSLLFYPKVLVDKEVLTLIEEMFS